MKSDVKRIYLLDELRGFAIVCMVFHHFFLDVGDVLNLSWGYKVFDALCIVQPLFWGLFIIISGICSRLSRNPIKRGAIVLSCGIALTLFTVFIMPLFGFDNAQIYFGILSCLGSSMIITGLLMPLVEKINTKVGITVCAFLFLATYSIGERTLLFGAINLPDSLYQYDFLCPIGLYSSSFYSADYFAIFPWVFLFLCGAFIGKYAKSGNFPEYSYKLHSKFFRFMGKNSLYVYMLHQVVLYGILYIVSFIMLIKA